VGQFFSNSVLKTRKLRVKSPDIIEIVKIDYIQMKEGEINRNLIQIGPIIKIMMMDSN
jgi:hypothetical protein